MSGIANVSTRAGESSSCLTETDIKARTGHWGEHQQNALIRERQYAIETVSDAPWSRGFGDHIHSAHGSSGPADDKFPQNRLCPACTRIISVIDDLLSKASRDGRMGAHNIALDYTLGQVHESAQLGCHLCALLESSTMRIIKDGQLSSTQYHGESIDDTWLWLVTSASIMEETRCNVRMGLMNAEVSTITSSTLSFYPPDVSLINPGGEISQYPATLASSTSDAATFEIVSGWIKTCHESHALCRQVRPAEPNVPRRLLHLEQSMVRVIENTQQAPYVCLSHCWGSQANVPHKLTEGGQYEPFEISALPQTFRDAIEITKRLGFEHIWIDCFCIVQGSKQDWIEQSAVMAQIYANSALTIAALAGKNTHAGCFMNRNPLGLLPLQNERLHVQPRENDNLWSVELDGYQDQSSPLHTRAWVVQERLSSCRTIFYGAMGVYWECRCMHASETFVKLVEDTAENKKTMLLRLQAAAEKLGSPEAPIALQASVFLARWQRLLQVYTLCALTYFSDKLIALSGITNDIEKYAHKEYVQGLWKDDMATGLLWVHVYASTGVAREDRSGRVTDSGFPTWSWASMLGEITYYNVQGQVTWSAPASIVDGSSEQKLRLTTWKRSVTMTSDEYIVLEDDGSRQGDLDEDILWYPDQKEPDDVPMEIVLIQRVTTSQSPWLRAVRCLVITQVEDRVYRRVGAAFPRFDRPKYDPFPAGEPIAGENDIIIT